MARPAAVGARLPVPVRGRYVAQAHLGVGREHQHPSRGRRGRHRSPQGHRRRGGHEGEPEQLGAVHPLDDRRGVRLVIGDRCSELISTISAMPPGRATSGAWCIHAQRPLYAHPQTSEVAHFHSYAIVRLVNPRPGARPGRKRGRGDGLQRPEGHGLMPEGGHRRVNHLSARRIPCRAPAADPHQQHDRTAQPRDPQEDTRRRQLPDGRSALMLIYAHIRYVTASQWSTHRYLDVSRLDGTMQSTHRDHVRRRVDHIRARHWAQPKRINELIQMNI